MKTKFFLLLFIVSFVRTYATDYFVTNAGGSGNGTSQATAWNVPKLRTMFNTLQAGDRILFNAGETYYTDLICAGNAGTQASPIVYTSYGTGAKPIISGMQTVTGWTAHPTISGVYYASFDQPEVQIVTVDGVAHEMGRYPKTGYLNIDSHSGRTSLTSSAIASMPFNPQGGRAVIKKAMYIIDRHNIISRSGNTITIDEPNDDYGNANSIYELSDGNGWFVQAHPNTLTSLGDWYYDKSAKRLYVHFGGGNSSSHVIQASGYQKLVQCSSRSYITFDGLEFRGANLMLLDMQYASHITITNCIFRQGTNGISGLQGAGYNSVTNTEIDGMYNNAISTWEMPYFDALNNYIHDTHNYAGMGLSGDLNGNGMALTGNHINVLGNRVIRSGYNGISFYGSNLGVDSGKSGNHVLVKNNLVDTYCTIKDDGGGIYTYGSAYQRYTNRVIEGNIVLNGIGNVEGAGAFATEARAMGIYLDNFSSDVMVRNNYVAHATGGGVFFNSNSRDTAINNTFVDNRIAGFLMLHLQNQQANGLYVTGNTFIGLNGNPLMNFEMYNPLSNLSTNGVFGNNTFYNPFGSASVIRVDDRQNSGMVVTDRTIAQFRAAYGQEQGSVLSTVPMTSPTSFFEATNYSPAPVNVSSTTVKKDILNNTYTSSSLQVDPYNGRFLIETSTPIVPPPANSIKIYRRVRLF